MKNIPDLVCCVIDNGVFLPVARRLGKEYGKVYYYTPSDSAFPTLKNVIGDGFDEIERVESPWTVADKVDLWCFPDVGFSALQKELIRQGKIVWGARDGDILETSRGKFLEALMSTDLPMPPYHKIIGMTELREFLKDKQDKFIKVSKYRGDWETLHFKSWAESELELDVAAVHLGPWKELIAFYVFDNIDTEIEDGCDSHSIDGQFPSVVIHGMECKDRAYLGTFQKFDDLPKEVRCVNEAFGPILKSYGYRGFFSTEVRITKEGESYFIDPTCRAGSPPSQVMCEMIGNLGEIVWLGAQGEVVDPEPSHKFGVQALVTLKKGSPEAWGAMEINPEVDQWLKASFCSKIGDRLCFDPEHNPANYESAWMVGVGDTIKAAIDHLKENAENLSSGCVDIESMTELLKEVHQAEDAGMEVTDQPVPEPETVMQETT